MVENTKKLVITVLATSALAGGVYYCNQRNSPMLDKNAKLPKFEYFMQPYSKGMPQLVSLDEVTDPITIKTPKYGHENPVYLTWSDNAKITIDELHGEITCNGKTVVKWADKTHKIKENGRTVGKVVIGPAIMGASMRELEAGEPWIPMSTVSFEAHPLHKQYRYKNYDWLNELLPPNGTLELVQKPKADINDYAMRRWGYQNAVKTAIQIRDWLPPPELHDSIPNYERKHNILPLEISRMESQGDPLPGPNSYIVNRFGFMGAFQQHNTSSLTSSKITTRNGNWAGKVLGGKPIKSRQDFLGNVDAQMVALIYQFRQMEKTLHAKLSDTIKEKTSWSSLLGAAHLVGAHGAAEAVLNGIHAKDRNGTTHAAYMNRFRGYDEFLYPYSELHKPNLPTRLPSQPVSPPEPKTKARPMGWQTGIEQHRARQHTSGRFH